MDIFRIAVVLIIIVVAYLLHRFGYRRGEQHIQRDNYQDWLAEVQRLHEACFRVGTTYNQMNRNIIGGWRKTDWQKIQKELVKKLPHAISSYKRAIKRARKQKQSPEMISNLVQTRFLLEDQFEICEGCQERQKESNRFQCELRNQPQTAWMNENGNIHI